MSKGKTHYACHEAPHEGDNTEYWGDPICGSFSENLTEHPEDVTCNRCFKLLQQTVKYKRIISLLRKAGFEQTEEVALRFANMYCLVCLDYQKKDETVIVNNYGGIMEQLPTNYYAILGWLLEKHMVSISILDTNT